MLYPQIESDYYSNPSSFHSLLSEKNIKSIYKISVTNHCKTETPLETFIEFTIVTEHENLQTIVQRRYSDFFWLMKHLNTKYSFYILPPIPAKRMFSSTDKFSRHFIDQRKLALERMLQRLSGFQICLHDPKMEAFLKYQRKDFILYRKTHKIPSLLKTIQISLQKVYDDTILSFKSEDGIATTDESTMSCFEILHKRIAEKSSLTFMLTAMDDVSFECEMFSQCLLWAAQNVADIVIMTESCNITIVMDGIARFLFDWSAETKVYFNTFSNNIKPILVDYIAYDDNIINIIRDRNKAKSTLGYKKKSIISIQSVINPVDCESLPKGSKFDQLMAESIILEDQLTDFDRIFFPSISDWQHQKSCDLAQCLSDMVKNNIRYHKACLEMCQNLLNKIISNDC